MPIPVLNNEQYGGNLINQKYAPLAINDPQAPIDNGAQAEYVALFQNRINLLTNRGLLPSQLNLYAADWPAIQTAESAPASLPPIVVVSSNRAEWIFNGYELAKNLQPLGANFSDVNDVRALVAGPTPWYLPKRVNDAARHVYVVVHRLEYDFYSTLLANTGMKVIGWEFDAGTNILSSTGSIIGDTYLGFGASRFAAIEFCKYVFNVLIAPPLPPARQKAWIVDDNVAYVSKFLGANGLSGFAALEGVMDNTIWGLGFSGATRNSTDEEVSGLVAPAAAGLGNLSQEGLLQQCVLWNISQLNAQHLNYSPYFITSNEDTSLSSFLGRLGRLRIVAGPTVVKGTPENGIGAEDVTFLRDRLVEGYYAGERNTQVTPPAQGGTQALSTYVVNHLLPQAQESVHLEPPWYAESKAVEQLMAKIVGDRPAWVPPLIFRPNGADVQPTQHL